MNDKKKRVLIVGIGIVISLIVSIVVMNLTEKIIFVGNEGNLNNEEPYALVEPDKWETSKVTKYVDSEGNVAPIPKGYSVSQVTGENLIRTGLVIYEGETPVTGDAVGVYGSVAWNESCNRNQWVWVPCPDPSRIYEEDSTTGKKKGKLYSYTSTGRSLGVYNRMEPRAYTGKRYDNEKYFGYYNMLGMTKERLQNELESEYEATIESIKKYGGFYIGRYETGNVGITKPVVQRMNNSTSGRSWDSMYHKMKYLGANENIKSNMIWGSLWDETLQWLVESEAKDSNGSVIGYAGIKNSTSWGDYNPSEFNYYSKNGNMEIKSSGKYAGVPTGSTEYTNVNNIYDMAGNREELTLEGYTDTGYTLRGSWYASGGAADRSSNMTTPSYTSNDYGRSSCVLLYKIKF